MPRNTIPNEYAFEHNGRQFVPSGAECGIDNVLDHNQTVEAREIESLKQHPDRLFLYVRETGELKDGSEFSIGTWMGTTVSTKCRMSGRRFMGFGGAYRRSVDCIIFGVRYVGWFFESSGSYCRLRKAAKQPKVVQS